MAQPRLFEVAQAPAAEQGRLVTRENKVAKFNKKNVENAPDKIKAGAEEMIKAPMWLIDKFCTCGKPAELCYLSLRVLAFSPGVRPQYWCWKCWKEKK